MKRFSFIAFCFAIAMAFSPSAFGQTVPAAAGTGKIGLVNVNAFADEKAGITRFRTALASLDAEFKTLNDEISGLRTRYTAIATEVQGQQKLAADPNNKVPINTSALQTKIDEAQNLEVQIKRKQEDGKSRYEKRYQAVVGPVFGDIVKALNDFARQKGYAVILDGAKLEESGLLMGFDDKYDVTKDFVVFYNARPAGTATTAAPPK